MEIFELNKDTLEQINATEINLKQKKQHEFKLVGRQRRIPGLTMWCINLKTGEIKKAPIDHSKAIDFKTREPIYRDRIVIEPNCLYRQCLNRKSFIKRLIKEGVIKRYVQRT